MCEHIDNAQLMTDISYRYNYLSKFLNFTSDDIILLNKLAPILLPRIPIIVDTVYRKLLSFDITKQYFLLRHDGFNDNLFTESCDLTLESKQMIFRKEMLSLYLKKVFTQKVWDKTFLEYLSQVGKIHTNHAGSPLIKVDLIHINVLLGYIENLLTQILSTIENFDDKTKINMILSIHKFFCIQNDFFSMHYLP